MWWTINGLFLQNSLDFIGLNEIYWFWKSYFMIHALYYMDTNQ